MTFSYTDDAIIVLSGTGRKRGTVVRRPLGMPNNGWGHFAEQVCKALNELDPINTLISGLVGAAVADLAGSLKDPVNEALQETLKQRSLQVSDLQAQVESLKSRTILLTDSERQSGYDRVKWAEGLIRQLPETHDGRNSWLLNYGTAEPKSASTGPSMADLIDSGHLAPVPRKFYGDSLVLDFTPLEKRVTRGRRGQLIALLTSQLASVEAELARAHEQLRKPVELSGETLAALASMKPGTLFMTFGSGRPPLKRV